MKKLGLGLASLFTAINIYAQGDVVFDNFGGGLVHNNVTGADVSAADGVVVELYASATGAAGSFIAVTSSIVQVGILADGFYDRGVVRIPATIIPHGGGVFLEVRGWETAYGATYEEAIAAPAMNGRSSLRGTSTGFMLDKTGDPTTQPPGVPVVLSDLVPALALDAPSTPGGPSVACDPIAPIECTGAGGANATLNTEVSHPNGSAMQVVWTVNGVAVQTNDVPATSPRAGTPLQLMVFLPLGSNRVDISASDSVTTPTVCSRAVTVMDQMAPSISCPADMTAECAGTNGTTVQFEVVASDMCQLAAPAACTPPAGSVFAAGATRVNCVAADIAGNTNTCSFMVTVRDTAGPVITCASDLTVECSGSGAEVVTFTVTATDACDTNFTVTCQPPSGAGFGLGATTVNCSAADGSLNTNSCSFIVTVHDTTRPNINCPQNISVEGTQPVPVEFTVTANDVCDSGPTVVCTPASNSTFPLGQTTVHCVATDAGGNTNDCQFVVTVGGGNQPPTVSCGELPVFECDGPQGLTITIHADVEDPDGDPLEVVWTVNGTSVQTNSVPAGGPPTMANVQLVMDLPLGTNVVMVSVSDAQSLPIVCSREAIVRDTSGPTLMCPANITNACAGASGAVVQFEVMASDFCDTNLTLACQPPSGATFALGSTTVSCAAYDSAGNTNTCSFTVAVRDTVGPSVTCGGNRTADCAGTNGTVVEFVVTATDACDPNPTVTCEPASGTSFPAGITRIMCTASDSSGNNGGCSFTVNVLDTVAPIVTCPTNQTVECTGPGNQVEFAVSATDACDTNVIIACQPPSGSAFGLGVTLVTCAASDSANNTNTCSFMVSVVDTTAPSITCPANISVPGTEPVPVQFTVQSSDACDSETLVECTPPSNSLFPLGQTTVRCTASDDSGLTNQCSFVVTVGSGNRPPSVSCAPIADTECTGATGARTTIDALVEDPDGDALRVLWKVNGSNVQTNNVPAGGPPTRAQVPLTADLLTGSNVVEVSVSDLLGTPIVCSRTAVVVDTSAPALTCPTNQVVDCAGVGGTPVQFEVSAADVCDSNLTVTCVPPSGSTFISGVTTVTCAASDSGGNTNTCSFTVTVLDTRGPSVTCGGNRTAECAGTNGTVVEFVVTATDTCDANPTVNCDPPSGTSFPAGITRIMCTASDGAGNNGGCSFTVNVLDTVAPIVTCPTNQTVDCAGAGGTVVQFEATVTDGCDTNATVTCEPPSGSTFISGVTTVTCAASDSGGNTNTCSFTVTVLDTRGPSVTCGGNRTAECAGTGGTVVEFVVTATDACDPNPTVTCEPASGTSFPVGTNRVMCTARDGAGNSGGCSFTVNVLDTVAPIVTCPTNQTVDCAGAGGTVVQFEATVTDGCDTNATVTCEPPSGSTFISGVTTVTCAASDSGGNTNTCSFTVTVLDTRGPSVTCGGNRTAECAGTGGTVVEFVVTATDACDPNPTVTCEPASGTSFPVGTNRVMCTARDGAGNSGGCSFTVNVLDTVAPIVTCPTNQTVDCAGAGGTVVQFEATVTDGCDTNATVTCVPPSGSTFISGVTTVTCAASDSGGNTNTCSFTVTVLDTRGPSVTCGGNRTAECAGTNGTVVEFVVTATDTCDANPTVNCDPPSGTSFPAGITRIMCTASDGAGNNGGCSFTVNVLDTVAPVVTCPANQTVDCAGVGGTLVEFEATVTDGCDTNATVTCVPPSGSTFISGVTTVTCAASDSGGNTNTCSFTVTVLDTRGPSVTCGGNRTAECAGTNGTVVEFVVTATDTCDANPTVNCDPPSGTSFPAGITRIMCTASDGAGNNGGCSFTVNVLDTVAPVVTCPANQTVDCAGVGGTLVEFEATVTDGCDTNATVTCVPPSGSTFISGVTTVTCAASDSGGNTNTCSFTVTVLDTRGPSVTCGGNRTAECAGANGTVVEFVVTATDTCDANPTVNCDPPSGTSFPAGLTRIMCTASDGAGNNGGCSFTVNVLDTVAPVVTCPANQTVDCAGAGGTPVQFDVIATDACDTNATVTCEPPSGSTFTSGVTTVTCAASDSGGNTNTCSFTVTVLDTRGPSVTCGGNRTAECAGAGGTVVEFVVTATDACDPNPTVTCEPPSGTSFPVGTNRVMCTARDGAGNSGGCSFTVNVLDTVGPSVTCPPNQTVDCAGAGGTPVQFEVTVTDGCDTNATVTCEPPSGSTFISGVTTVTCAASDSGGNTNTCSFTVTVLDTRGPSVMCGGNRTAECAGAGGTVVEFVVTATDTCDPSPTVTCEPASGTSFPAGITRIMCTARDGAGNSGGCSFTVNVLDTVAPIVTCPANQTVNCAGAGGTPVQFEATVTDGCDTNATVTCQPASGSSFPSGVTTVTCSASDSGGNTNTCSFTIEVRDTVGPSVTCGGNRTAECAGTNGTVVEFVVTATDACDPNPTVTCEPPSGTSFPAGITRIMCTARDGAGNSGGCSFTVNVLDTVAPIVTCPTNIVVDSPEGTPTNVTFVATATDACDGDLTATCNPTSGSLFSPGSTVVTCQVSDGAGNSSSCTFSVNVSVMGEPGFVLEVIPGRARNDFTGAGGMSFTVGANQIVVTEVGRFVVEGNTGTHRVYLVQASDRQEVPGGSALVFVGDGEPGTFKFAPLAKPVTLLAGKKYYLLSEETKGGDAWYDIGTAVTVAPIAQVNGGVFQGGGYALTEAGPGGHSYVPPNFRYQTLKIVCPVEGGVYTGDVPVEVQVNFVPTNVSFFANGVKVGEINGGGTSIVFTNPPPGEYAVTAIATDSGGAQSQAGPVQITIVEPIEELVKDLRAGGQRNDFSGMVGYELTVNKPVLVKSLGRYVLQGNTGAHVVKLVHAADGTDVPGATATIATAGAPAGEFKYEPLLTPVTLQPGVSYYLVTEELRGGDRFLDANSHVTLAPIGHTKGAVFAGGGYGWTLTGFEGSAYGVPGLEYDTANLLTMVCNDGTGASLLLAGAPGDTYIIESSEDGLTWKPIGTHTLAEPAIEIRIDEPVADSMKFYRAVLQQ